MTTLIPSRNPGTTVTALPTDPGAAPPIPTGDSHTGHYQSVLLNIRSGELTMHHADWRERVTQDSPREAWEAHYPGTLVSWRGQWITPVPTLLRWVIDSGRKDVIPDRPYLTIQQGNEFVDYLVPFAQALVDQLFRVDGTTDLDWSAESATAMRTIKRACDRRVLPPEDAYPDLVNFHDAVAAVPRLAAERLQRWPEMNDAQLDRQCEGLTRYATSELWHRDELLAAFPGEPAANSTVVYLDVLGIRAWAWAYRASTARVEGQA